MDVDTVVGKESSELHAGRVLAPHPRTAHGVPSISQCRLLAPTHLLCAPLL